MSRNLAFVFLALGFVVAGCRDDNNNITPSDFSMVGGNVDMAMNNTGGDMAMSTVKCSTGYTDTTIAMMRSAMKSGCYRVGMMAPVVQLVTNHTGSGSHAESVFQDSAGGDFSAIEAQCDTRAKAVSAGYGCTVEAQYAAIPNGHAVTVGGFYVHTSAGLEFFNVIDQISDSGSAGTVPQPVALAATDIAWKSTTVTAAKQFQMATVSGGPFKAYDWAPAAFKPTSFSSCSSTPASFGFGIVPATSTDTQGPACTAGQTEMPPTTEANDEILIDTSFYNNFDWTGDCECFQTGKGNLMASTDVFTSLKGIVVFENTSPAIAPTADADIGK